MAELLASAEAKFTKARIRQAEELARIRQVLASVEIEIEKARTRQVPAEINFEEFN
jgi:hypothetical protein